MEKSERLAHWIEAEVISLTARSTDNCMDRTPRPEDGL